jgi:hypothetical protein
LRNSQADEVLRFKDQRDPLGRADLIINGNAMTESGGKVERSMGRRNGNMVQSDDGAPPGPEARAEASIQRATGLPVTGTNAKQSIERTPLQQRGA